MDELAQSPADAEKPSSGGAKGPIRAYHETVLCERQPRLCDLIPVRPATLTITLLTVLTAAAGVIGLYTLVAEPGGRLPAVFSPLDLRQPGGLASWSLSLLFATGATYALVIFSIRAHRIDDYRGNYRIWLWTAAALVWASLDSATGLGAALAALGAPAAHDGRVENTSATAQLVWLGGCLLAYGALALQLGLETRASRLTGAALASACGCLLAAGAVRLGALPVTGAALAAVALASCELAAGVAVLAGLLFYARHVYLDAAGRLLVDSADSAKPKRKGRGKAKLAVVKDEAEDDAPDQVEPEEEAAAEPAAAKPAPTKPAPAKIEAKPEPKPEPKPESKHRPELKPGPLKFAASQPPASAAQSSAAVKQESDEDEEADFEDAEDGDERLSRSERKRLKKLARRDPQRRAA